jgi:hypothetical protein
VGEKTKVLSFELQGAHAQFSYCFATQACAYVQGGENNAANSPPGLVLLALLARGRVLLLARGRVLLLARGRALHLVLLGGPHLPCAGPHLVSAGPHVVSAGPHLVSAGPHLVSAGALVVGSVVLVLRLLCTMDLCPLGSPGPSKMQM